MPNITDSLSPHERKVLPHVGQTIESISEKTGLDQVSVTRALQFLQNKHLVTLNIQRKVSIDLSTNGIQYKKTHLPERLLLIALDKHRKVSLGEVKKKVKLSDNELKAAIGVLRRKALATIEHGDIILTAQKEELAKPFPEESFIQQLPLDEEALTPEQRYAYEILEKRKDILEKKEFKTIHSSLTPEGKKAQNSTGKAETLIEQVTPEMIKTGVKNKRFRHYDLKAPVPRLSGGRIHMATEGIEHAKKIWLEMGFTEMTGKLVDSSFWVFDSLFTAQDHPVREIQDSFFIKNVQATLPDKKIVEQVQKAHEGKIADSKGWQYTWSEEKASKVVLRTHTTSLSARMLASLSKKDLPVKYFAIGKAFRNETIDWSHGIEFYQTEGIVVDEKATFRDLIGLLQEFYKKMGFKKIRWRPAYFPYTEPSLEIDVFHEGKQKWIEYGGAGIFRPEVVIPLFGTYVPVLAWGQGLDRMLMEAYKLKDLRELYGNDIQQLRERKVLL